MGPAPLDPVPSAETWFDPWLFEEAGCGRMAHPPGRPGPAQRPDTNEAHTTEGADDQTAESSVPVAHVDYGHVDSVAHYLVPDAAQPPSSRSLESSLTGWGIKATLFGFDIEKAIAAADPSTAPVGHAAFGTDAYTSVAAHDPSAVLGGASHAGAVPVTAENERSHQESVAAEQPRKRRRSADARGDMSENAFVRRRSDPNVVSNWQFSVAGPAAAPGESAPPMLPAAPPSTLPVHGGMWTFVTPTGDSHAGEEGAEAAGVSGASGEQMYPVCVVNYLTADQAAALGIGAPMSTMGEAHTNVRHVIVGGNSTLSVAPGMRMGHGGLAPAVWQQAPPYIMQGGYEVPQPQQPRVLASSMPSAAPPRRGSLPLIAVEAGHCSSLASPRSVKSEGDTPQPFAYSQGESKSFPGDRDTALGTATRRGSLTDESSADESIVQAGRPASQPRRITALNDGVVVKHLARRESEGVFMTFYSQKTQKQCANCKTTRTPQWRRGPDGEMSLCNACGLRYFKWEKKNERDVTKPPTEPHKDEQR